MSSAMDLIPLSTTPWQLAISHANGKTPISMISQQAFIRNIASIAVSGIFFIAGSLRLLQLRTRASKNTNGRNSRIVKLVSIQYII